MRAIDYIPAFVAAVALVLGIAGSPLSWNTRPHGFLRKLTSLGRVAFIVGVIGLIGSIYLTWQQHTELDFHTSQQEHLRRIAHTEIRLALRETIGPFFNLFGDDTKESQSLLVPAHIEDPDRLKAVMRIDVRSKSPFDEGYGPLSWDRVLKEAADRGAARIDRVMQIYASYLEPDVLEALSDIRNSEFLVLRLQGLDTDVEINKNLKFLYFPFVNVLGFGEFWKTMRKLDNKLLFSDPDRLRRRM
jgi:hypothetical protein